MLKSCGMMASVGLCLAALMAEGCSKSATSTGKPAAGGASKSDSDRIQGKWLIVAVEAAGEKVPEKEIKDSPGTFTFTGDKLTQNIPGKMDESSTFKLDTTKKPKTITLTTQMEKRELINGEMKDSKIDVTTLGIYELDGDQLKICLNMPLLGPKDAPTDFKTSKDKPRMLFVLKRDKK